jgi:glycosyltransferase involved in cell wall biosynthesis
MIASLGMTKAMVSVIIPCFNQAHFLEEAIESVLRQSWNSVEILVVDDGSTDATRIVATKFNEVKYLYQENQGVSTARNTGIKNSNGQYLVFLDSDDWLYPDAIITNIQLLIEKPYLAYVSGAYDFVDAESQHINETFNPIEDNHYIKLLEGNYIGSPAAVMYQRWAFDKNSFDSSVDACSDYDIYLNLARIYPVTHQTKKVAAYRKHNLNMSANIPIMLSTALIVLQRQKINLKNKEEKKAFERGIHNWKRYYSNLLAEKLLKYLNKNNPKLTGKEITILLNNFPVITKFFIYRLYFVLKNNFKRMLIPEHLFKS